MSSASPPPELHLVLVEPEIPWNTGNCGRSCLAFGARLHLIRPLGFSLDAHAVRRAGLDYWERVPVSVHDDWEACQAALGAEIRPWLLCPRGEHRLSDLSFSSPTVLVVGRESTGLSPELLDRYPDRRVRIPQAADSIRSLNQSTAAAVAMYEVRRRGSATPDAPSPNARSGAADPD